MAPSSTKSITSVCSGLLVLLAALLGGCGSDPVRDLAEVTASTTEAFVNVLEGHNTRRTAFYELLAADSAAIKRQADMTLQDVNLHAALDLDTNDKRKTFERWRGAFLGLRESVAQRRLERDQIAARTLEKLQVQSGVKVEQIIELFKAIGVGAIAGSELQ